MFHTDTTHLFFDIQVRIASLQSPKKYLRFPFRRYMRPNTETLISLNPRRLLAGKSEMPVRMLPYRLTGHGRVILCLYLPALTLDTEKKSEEIQFFADNRVPFRSGSFIARLTENISHRFLSAYAI